MFPEFYSVTGNTDKLAVTVIGQTDISLAVNLDIANTLQISGEDFLFNHFVVSLTRRSGFLPMRQLANPLPFGKNVP